MEKIEMIRYLLDEVEQEQNKFFRYESENKRAMKESAKTGESSWLFKCWDEPIPKKSRISDNCKMARRLLLSVEKESV